MGTTTDQAIAALRDAFGVDPWVESTGGGSAAIVVEIPGVGRMMVSDDSGCRPVPDDTDDSGDHWLVGVYDSEAAVYAGDAGVMLDGPAGDHTVAALVATARAARDRALVVADQRESYPEMTPDEAIAHVIDTLCLPGTPYARSTETVQDDGSATARAYIAVLTAARGQ